MSASLAKFKWKPRLRESLLPAPRVLRQVEVIALLGRALFDDAVSAGWLEPCARRANARDVDSKWYAAAAVAAVEDRVLAGEVPARKGGRV